MKEGQCGWRVGRRASIDKLLPVLDRYDWMPAVMVHRLINNIWLSAAVPGQCSWLLVSKTCAILLFKKVLISLVQKFKSSKLPIFKLVQSSIFQGASYSRVIFLILQEFIVPILFKMWVLDDSCDVLRCLASQYHPYNFPASVHFWDKWYQE